MNVDIKSIVEERSLKEQLEKLEKLNYLYFVLE